METKEKLLKDLGFSDEFLKEIRENKYENHFENTNNFHIDFNTFNTKELDLKSLIIEKTETPLNLNAVYIS